MLVFLSVETGGLEAGTLAPEEAAALLSAFTPGEVLHPATLRTPPGFLKGYALLPVTPEVFRLATAAERLRSALGGARLASFGIEENDPCTRPAWSVYF